MHRASCFSAIISSSRFLGLGALGFVATASEFTVGTIRLGFGPAPVAAVPPPSTGCEPLIIPDCFWPHRPGVEPLVGLSPLGDCDMTIALIEPPVELSPLGDCDMTIALSAPLPVPICASVPSERVLASAPSASSESEKFEKSESRSESMSQSCRHAHPYSESHEIWRNPVGPCSVRRL